MQRVRTGLSVLLLFAGLAAPAATSGAPGAPVAASRVFVLGVDGGSWGAIDPLLKAGDLPNLEALLARGVSADFETVEPVSSPVVWTSLATGRSPDAHGITDFFGTRLRIAVPSTFERLAASGLRVGLYDYLMTWPPVSLPGGFVIPGWLRRDDSVTPPDVWSRIPLTPYANDYDTPKTSADYLRLARLDATLKAPRFLALAEAFGLDVGAFTIYSVDMTSHRFWHGLAPGEFDTPIPVHVPGEATAVADAMRAVDGAIGEVVAALEPRDVLLIASDHGFQAEASGARNVWVTRIDDAVAAAGLDPDRDGFSVVGSFGAVTFRVHPGAPEDLATRDAMTERLANLLRSYRAPDGAPLFRAVESIDVAERPPGNERPWLRRVREWVVATAVRVAFGATVDPSAHAVVFSLPDDDVLASLAPDTQVTVGGRSVALAGAIERQVFTGMHHEIGIFAAAGGPIAARAGRTRLSVLDVSPLLFYLTGRPIPDDLEGRLPQALIDPAYLAAHPPRSMPAAEVPALPPSATTGVSIEDPALVERLRSLGYLE